MIRWTIFYTALALLFTLNGPAYAQGLFAPYVDYGDRDATYKIEVEYQMRSVHLI